MERIAPGLLFSHECTPQISITEIAKWPLRFVSAMFSLLHSITNEQTLGEEPLVSQQKIRMIPVKCREAITWHYHESTP